MNDQETIEFVKFRILECDYERRAHELWLDFLGRLNWISVVVPAALAVFAGAALFKDDPDWKTVPGVTALLSGLLTAVLKR